MFQTNIHSNIIVSITEANQNFSKVTRMVDERGSIVSKSIIAKNREAYAELVNDSTDTGTGRIIT